MIQSVHGTKQRSSFPQGTPSVEQLGSGFMSVARTCKSGPARFWDSLLSLSRMPWDHEPTPNHSQEGNGQVAAECLLPFWEGSGVGRFMESLLSLLRMPWDHEPRNWSAGLQPGAINVFLRRRTWRSGGSGLRFRE